MLKSIPRTLLFLGLAGMPSFIAAKPMPFSGATVAHYNQRDILSLLHPEPDPLSSAPGETYIVRPGDTAWNIATSHDITFEELKKANPSVQDWDNILVGQALNIPGPCNGGLPGPPPWTPNPNDIQVIEALAVHNLDQDEGAPLQDVYSTFQGDGSLHSNWPAKSQWVSFNAMWNHVEPGLGRTCVGGVQSNSEQETKDLKDAILTISAEFLIDPRFVLAVVLQESNGCVRVATTTPSNEIRNPGVMQTSNGAGSCNDGVEVSPCPQNEIYKMILDGVHGGDNNLVKAINSASFVPGLGPAEEAQAFYRAARTYNSGFSSFTDGADLAQNGAMECYSSDIGNRLLGWYSAEHTCWLNHD
ncbi:hypothetical protein LTR84_012276 [Exophiala bonariae]|uniref:LysM domain-containing protein n=1 Tax=Exophiala bonariae TaxID=1690606 RepID=A0AAV9NG90_9EURO|nr:hypothetical protein LTR84_012276 [Exophiala bonariae]